MDPHSHPVPQPDARLQAAEQPPATARCGAMGHHGRCVLTQGHDDTIAHLYATPATPVPAEPTPALSPTLTALRDALADPRPIDLTEALASARTLLAAHTRELAAQVDGLAAPDCADMSSLDDAWECGNSDTAAELRRYADDLDAPAAGGEL